MSLRFGIKRLWSLGNFVATRSSNFSQTRQQSAIGGPPGNPMKTWELFAYGGGMALAVLYLPIYTLYHIREYNGTKNPPAD